MSLEKQLSAEYLQKLGRTHGVYAVGWFQAAGWKQKNNPLRAQTFREAEVSVAKLLATAKEKFPALRLDAICLNCEFPLAFRKRL